VLKHYKVIFDIQGKIYPFTWFCFMPNYAAAKQAANNFLQEELAKGFYSNVKIKSIKEF